MKKIILPSNKSEKIKLAFVLLLALVLLGCVVYLLYCGDTELINEYQLNNLEYEFKH